MRCISDEAKTLMQEFPENLGTHSSIRAFLYVSPKTNSIKILGDLSLKQGRNVIILNCVSRH